MFQGGLISRQTTPVFLPQTSVSIRGRMPPPVIISARLSDAGSSAIVIFSAATSGEVNGRYGSLSCDLMFSNTNLGSESQCYFTSSTTLQIDFGFGATVLFSTTASGTLPCDSATGDGFLQLRSGVIRTVPGAVLSTPAMCTAIVPPLNPQPPVVALEAPRIVSPCETILVDASGTVDLSGRQLTFNWTIVPLNDIALNSSFVDSSSLLAAISRGDSTLTIDVGELSPGGVARVIVNVTNSLGGTAGASVDVTASSVAVPAISLKGPAVWSITAHDNLDLQADGSASTCASGDTQLSFAWTLTSQSLNLDIAEPTFAFTEITASQFATFVTRDPSRLSLPQLTPGVMYSILVRVQVHSDASQQNFATTTVSVGSAGVVAVIAGGDRQIGSGSPLTLNASGSQDLDRLTAVPFEFSWGCWVLEDVTYVPCTNGAGDSLDLSSYLNFDNSIMAIPPATLPAGKYKYTVTVTKGSVGGRIPNHFRTSSASVSIVVLLGTPPEITLGTVSPLKVNPQDRVVLSGSVSSLYGTPSLLWSSASMSTSQLLAITKSTSFTLDRLVLVPTLPKGYYTFTLTATTADGSSSFATVDMYVNGPPRNGYIAASPRNGTSMETPFSFSALDWKDEVR